MLCLLLELEWQSVFSASLSNSYLYVSKQILMHTTTFTTFLEWDEYLVTDVVDLYESGGWLQVWLVNTLQPLQGSSFLATHLVGEHN